ncbi:fibropellin-3-like [Lytechinus pictus]|uniref:fibropellin-3-like n=1 Tax=Lytechinus pictus TaxID=7653 RepID=UPI0030B9D09A
MVMNGFKSNHLGAIVGRRSLVIIIILSLSVHDAIAQEACTSNPCSGLGFCYERPGRTPNFACQCFNTNRMGFDCMEVGSFNAANRCFGYPSSTCQLTFFSSPAFPNNYPNGFSQMYQLYIQTATSIRLSFQVTFSIDVDDKLYVGIGLTVPTSFQPVDGILHQFSGSVVPNAFSLNTDTVWMLFRSDATGSANGWQLQWTATTDPCGWGPCLNGGTCTPNFQSNTFTCSCTPCYNGNRCEIDGGDCALSHVP